MNGKVISMKKTRRRGREGTLEFENSNILEFGHPVFRAPSHFISPSILYSTSLNGLVYDTSVTFGMHAAISKQRFLHSRSILRGHFVISLKYACYGFHFTHH